MHRAKKKKVPLSEVQAALKKRRHDAYLARKSARDAVHTSLREIIKRRLYVAWRKREGSKKKKRTKRKSRHKNTKRKHHSISFGPRFREQQKPYEGAVHYGVQDRLWPNGSVTEVTSFDKSTSSLGLREMTRTVDYLSSGPPFLGGEMFHRTHVENPLGDVQGKGISKIPYSAGTTLRYNGGFGAASFGPNTFATSSMANIGVSGPYGPDYGKPATADGPDAYLRAAPTIQRADAGVFLAEGRDLPRMLKTTAKFFHEAWQDLGGLLSSPIMQPSVAADHFLNHQFGWVPFLNDLCKFYDTYQNTDKYMSQIMRDNNKWVKRVRTIVQDETIQNRSRVYAPDVYPIAGLYGQLLVKRTIDGHANTYGVTDYYQVVKTREWFVASFKYYLPQFDFESKSFDGKYGQVQRLIDLYGLRVNPSMIYRATPWTWLGDWVSNAGKHVSYISQVLSNNLVNRYAFLMKTISTYNVNSSIVFMPGPDSERRVEAQQLITVKDRRKASPFGFQFDASNLTPRQLAILAALGISRG